MDELELLLIEQIRDCQSDQPVSQKESHEGECGYEQAYYYSTGIPYPDRIKSDDELRNINSFEYLRHIADYIPESLRDQPGFKEVIDHCSTKSRYLKMIPYGNYYTDFLIALSNYLREHSASLMGNHTISDDGNSQSDLIELDQLIRAVYLNQNLAVERTYAVINERIKGIRQTDNKTLNSIIKDRLQCTGEVEEAINKITPLTSASTSQEVKQVMGSTFNPMLITNQPSQLLFHYQDSKDPIQLRFCTQGMVDAYVAEVNPLFKGWLSSVMRSSVNKDEILHVYFNHMSRATEGVIRKRECRLTAELEKLESEFSSFVCINLPADSGFLAPAFAKDRQKPDAPNYRHTFDGFLSVVIGNDDSIASKDFHISKSVKSKLYGDGLSYDLSKEREVAAALITKSFITCGFDPELNNKLSPADQQAVYFHLMKYEMPNFILTQLKPRYFNFSCKDSIDRGASTSTYYNLIKSLQTPFPLTLAEFERSIHGAAAMVKGRGMNKQSHILWNTIDCLIDAATMTKLTMPDWLLRWRELNALPSSPSYYQSILRDYIKTRNREGDYHSFFGRMMSMNKRLKMTVAYDLLLAISQHHKRYSPSIASFVPNDSFEYKALHDGRLGKIVSEIESRHLIAIKPCLDEMTPPLSKTDSLTSSAI